MSGRRLNPAVLASVSIAGAAFAILGIVLAIPADGDDAPPSASKTVTPPTASEPTPKPEPEPEPEPEPVAAVLGEVVVEDLSTTSTGLYGSGYPGDGPVPTDEPAVGAFRDAIVAALDAHLLDQQQGGDGTLTTDVSLPLADADRPIATATIALRIGVRGTPEWARADVEVMLADGTAEHTELVFAPGEPPQILAVAR